MKAIYLIDAVGLVSGPVELPVIPGLGVLLPSNAIELPKALPQPAAGHAWCVRGTELAQLPYHGGTVYRTADGTPVQYEQLGALPPGLTTQPRPSEDHVWTGTSWVFDPAMKRQRLAGLAEELYASKIQLINAACEAEITGGFWSAALGDGHQYGSKLEDQLNLTGAVLRGVDTPYACRDDQGIRAFTLHSINQLRQVSDDLTQFKLGLLHKATVLKQQLDAALVTSDLVALAAVTWESEV